MAARKRKRLHPNKGVAAEAEGKEEVVEFHNWPDLPLEILEQILSRLTLQENIIASTVCKGWRGAASSVRVANQCPCLMYFQKSDALYEFYDPSQRKSYFLDLPELFGSNVCYSKYGWLLLYKPKSRSFFFCNPFTRESIKLPTLEINTTFVTGVAFSSAPTSSNCTVFTIRQVAVSVVGINTWHPGDTKWTSFSYQNPSPFNGNISDQVVFSNGRFYCSSQDGWLGVFDPQNHAWTILPVSLPSSLKCLEANSWKGEFLAEYNGEIFVMYLFGHQDPTLYKLDRANSVWEEMKTLDGMMLFVSYSSSHLKNDLIAINRNRVYFPKTRLYGKHCISYSYKDYKYKPRHHQLFAANIRPYESIWIEPPQDLASVHSHAVEGDTRNRHDS